MGTLRKKCCAEKERFTTKATKKHEEEEKQTTKSWVIRVSPAGDNEAEFAPRTTFVSFVCFVFQLPNPCRKPIADC